MQEWHVQVSKELHTPGSHLYGQFTRQRAQHGARPTRLLSVIAAAPRTHNSSSVSTDLKNVMIALILQPHLRNIRCGK